jgi:glutaredoxin-like protein
MEKFFNDDVRKQVTEILQQMVNPITIKLFLDKRGSESGPETKQLLEEFKDTNDKITLEVLDILDHATEAKQYDITLTPSFVMLDAAKAYKGVKFNGIPAGHEINSFISALIEMSGHALPFDAATMQRIKSIDKPVNIKVFVTLSCPHCPGAVQTAHRIAMLNPLVKSEMIEANTFPSLSRKHNVSGVPKIVINDSLELLGNQPIDAFLTQIAKL